MKFSDLPQAVQDARKKGLAARKKKRAAIAKTRRKESATARVPRGRKGPKAKANLVPDTRPPRKTVSEVDALVVAVQGHMKKNPALLSNCSILLSKVFQIGEPGRWPISLSEKFRHEWLHGIADKKFIKQVVQWHIESRTTPCVPHMATHVSAQVTLRAFEKVWKEWCDEKVKLQAK